MPSCPACSAPVAEDARFCSACGVDVTATDPEATLTSVPRGSPDASGSGSAGPASRNPSSRTPAEGRFVPGAVVAGRYRVVGLLGRGGMGEVYRADDLKLGQPVALKFLPRAVEGDPDRLERFVNEVRVARQVSHPNVCRVYDIGDVGGQHYLSMEFVDGEDLASLLRRIGRLPEDKAIQIGRQMCAGLAAAHAQGILHRDLKPANVMIDGRGRVRITDFGLAGLQASFSGAEIRAGTPTYMSPEQLEGREVTVRSDVYALGLVLYELFTGTAAFEAGSTQELLRLQRESRPARPSSRLGSIDPRVENVLLRCLERDPERRPSSPLAVAASLPGGDPLAEALAAGETPSPEMVAAAGRIGGLRPAAALALLAFCLVGVAATTIATGWSSAVGRLAPPHPPAVLEDRAVGIAKTLGYESVPGDRERAFRMDQAWLRSVSEDPDTVTRWDRIARDRPSPLRFWYRSSPRPLVPSNYGSTVTPDDPPLDVPGMIAVELDTRGHLVRFAAVPPRFDDTAVPASPLAWTPALAAAGIDPASLREVPPAWSAPVATDRSVAWEGTFAGASGAPVHVEAGAWRGRVAYFEVIPSWTPRTPAAASSADRIANVVLIVVLGTLVVGAALLARRNLRLGRGDRRGAFRLAAGVFAVGMTSWLFAADHVASLAEVGMLFEAIGAALVFAGIGWLIYVALEPYVRRLWPDTLVSWSRLIDGRWRDPFVGRSVLLGASVGVGMALLIRSMPLISRALGDPPTPPAFGTLTVIDGPFPAIGNILSIVLSAMIVPFGVMFVIVLMRFVLRRRWAAVGVTWLLFATLGVLQNQSGGAVATFAIVFGLVWAAVLTVLVRYGMASLLSVFVVANTLLVIGVPIAPSTWYFGTAIVMLLVPAGIVVYGFAVSIRGRALFRDDLLEG